MTSKPVYQNSVYIATSLDGYIADRNDGIQWLDEIPNPTQDDMGYFQFMEGVDAIVMGRNTFDKVLSFDVPWPYKIPVFVLSKTLKAVPPKLQNHQIQLISGTVKEVLNQIHHQGYTQLYIDGGNVIQQFLKEDCIDEMIITTIPVLLGGGAPLFGELTQAQWFQCIESNIHCETIVQNRFIRNQR